VGSGVGSGVDGRIGAGSGVGDGIGVGSGVGDGIGVGSGIGSSVGDGAGVGSGVGSSARVGSTVSCTTGLLGKVPFVVWLSAVDGVFVGTVIIVTIKAAHKTTPFKIPRKPYSA